MSRPASSDNSTAVSLFPFLAVLLCTMGALVVLLVVMAQAASHRAQLAEAQAAEAPPEVAAVEAPPAADPEAEAKLRLAEQQEAQLTALQAKAAESLRDDQTRLSHIEDHVRRLQEQLASLQAAALELQSLEDSYQDDRGQAEEELTRLQKLIAETEEEIERFDEEQRGKQKSYAIVPYKGPNGTRRRPVYIECRKDEVILQPEGVTLEAVDFRPPLGVGNPLSAALRAARKYYQKADPDTAFDPNTEPYPLILVRPEGIKLYHRVRAALESGDSDFGYEMVDGDWDLEFGLPNPVLANSEAQAIDAARLRRHLLSQAAPSAYESGGGASLNAASGSRGGRGGVRGAGGVLGVDSVDGSEASGSPRSDGSLEQRGPYSSADTIRYGETQQGAGLSGGSRGETGGIANADFRANNGQQPDDPYGAFARAGESDSLMTSQGASGGAGAQSGASSPNEPNQDANDANEAGDASSRTSGQVASGSSSQSSGSPTGSPSSAAAAAQAAAAEFNAQRNGGGSGVGGGGKQRRDDIAIRRSISVVVYGDRVVVTPVDSLGRAVTARATTVPLRGPTNRHVGDLMTAVRGQVNGWGIAGRGFYWKPVLVLSVAPSGAQRANELVTQLGPRGVEVRYHSTASADTQEVNGAQR